MWSRASQRDHYTAAQRDIDGGARWHCTEDKTKDPTEFDAGVRFLTLGQKIER